MDQQILKEIKEILLSQKKEIVEHTAAQDADVDGHGDEVDEIQAKQLLSLNKKISMIKLNKLNQIQDAIDRIDKGVYGLCDECADEINPKRLKMNPHYTTCVFCAEQKERRNK